MTPDRTDTELIADILRLGDPGSAAVDDVGERVQARVVESFRATGQYPRSVVHTLCQLEASDRGTARAAGRALIFTHLIETLSDAFEPRLAELYDAVFSQIIDYQRGRPEGRQLHDGLNRFGLLNEDDVRTRRLKLRRQGTQRVRKHDVRRVIVFSRVTVGADVAITSVIIRKLRNRYADAQIVLVAPPRIGELFAGDPQIEILPARYPRRGSLAERLSTWAAMMELITNDCSALTRDQVLFVDPDSRLTQLGLLPVANDDDYRIFESRTYGAGHDSNLGELAARWADETFGTTTEEAQPYLQLSSEQLDLGNACLTRLERNGKRIISISFGVGGNDRKRSGLQFETDLLLELVRLGHRLVLDRGIESDRDSGAGLIESLRSEGVTMHAAHAGNLEALSSGPGIDANVLTWTGGLGAFGALIQASDLYIGYDSAFQHVAAALGVPVVAIVLGSPGPLFRSRWHPFSNGNVRVIPEAGAGETPPADTLIKLTLLAVQDLIGN